MWVLSVRSWKSLAFIEASLEELLVHPELGQNCLAMKISAPRPSLLGGSATQGTIDATSDLELLNQTHEGRRGTRAEGLTLDRLLVK